MKKIITFAMVHAKNHIYTYMLVVFFIAANVGCHNGYHTPAITATYKSVMVLGGIGGDSLLYFKYLIFHTQMPRIMENASSTKHSNAASTSTERNTVQVPTPVMNNNAEQQSVLPSDLSISKETRNLLACLLSLINLYAQVSDALECLYGEADANTVMGREYHSCHNKMAGIIAGFLSDSVIENLSCINLTEI
jgi:hypothetical protein